MEGNQPIYAEAIAVKDGKIIFVGKKQKAIN
jgi:predicted amidohydrolase YtcJ